MIRVSIRIMKRLPSGSLQEATGGLELTAIPPGSSITEAEEKELLAEWLYDIEKAVNSCTSLRMHILDYIPETLKK